MGVFCLLETWRRSGMCQDSPLTSKPWESFKFSPDPPHVEGKRGCRQRPIQTGIQGRGDTKREVGIQQSACFPPLVLRKPIAALSFAGNQMTILLVIFKDYLQIDLQLVMPASSQCRPCRLVASSRRQVDLPFNLAGDAIGQRSCHHGVRSQPSSPSHYSHHMSRNIPCPPCVPIAHQTAAGFGSSSQMLSAGENGHHVQWLDQKDLQAEQQISIGNQSHKYLGKQMSQSKSFSFIQ
ncbi:hypothetical protein llap_9233 [Limosa lapponica baueri]|uniref:Uncharacterized protein n=1 Tax=Limosa lapponica baueri TaxID=1758121 RepID=A0A2I0U321_LIMLA|nr:hypothetical protein llap_9233 [Limosa lapponica baueri]